MSPKQQRAVYLGGNSSGMGIWDWNPEVRSKWPREGAWLPVWTSILPSFMRSGMNWELWDSSYPGWKCLRQWVAKDVEQVGMVSVCLIVGATFQVIVDLHLYGWYFKMIVCCKVLHGFHFLPQIIHSFGCFRSLLFILK